MLARLYLSKLIDQPQAAPNSGPLLPRLASRRNAIILDPYRHRLLSLTIEMMIIIISYFT